MGAGPEAFLPPEEACSVVEADLASLGSSILLLREALFSLGQGRQKALSPQRQLSNKGWVHRRLPLAETTLRHIPSSSPEGPVAPSLGPRSKPHSNIPLPTPRCLLHFSLHPHCASGAASHRYIPPASLSQGLGRWVVGVLTKRSPQPRVPGQSNMSLLLS